MNNKLSVKDMQYHMRAVKRGEFGGLIAKVIAPAELSSAILAAYADKENKGHAVGIYRKHDMVACLIFCSEGNEMKLQASWEAEDGVIAAGEKQIVAQLKDVIVDRKLDRICIGSIEITRETVKSPLSYIITPLFTVSYALLFGSAMHNWATGIGVGLCFGVSIGMSITRNRENKVTVLKEGNVYAA